MDGLDLLGFDLDVVPVEVDPVLVGPDVEIISVGIGLGDDQDVDPIQEAP
jgi:hypothetical protein